MVIKLEVSDEKLRVGLLRFNPQKQMTLSHRHFPRSWLASHDTLYFMSVNERPRFAAAAFEPDRH
jgi:hypothetical protein